MLIRTPSAPADASTTVGSVNRKPPVTAGARKAAWILLPIAAAVCVAVILWGRWWPFEPRTVLQNLAEASSSQVHVQSFQTTYWPSPGCVLNGVVFTNGPASSKPIITIQQLTIRGSYAGLPLRHVSRMEAVGMRVFVPAAGSRQPFQTTRSSISIGEIVADGAVLEIARNGDVPLRFEVQQLSLRDVSWRGPLIYRLKMHSSNPLAEITATGKFGVWNQADPARTPLSGEYQLERGDLGIYPGIAGTLASTGKFAGTLGEVDVWGATDTPDFSVNLADHPVRLTTQFDAEVDGTNGDVVLKWANADLGKTRITAQGKVAATAGREGKTASIAFATKDGRIQDLLGLFVKGGRSPMTGAVSLQAKAELPPGDRAFLKKVTLGGLFNIASAEFSKPSTQQQVNELSAGARGEKHPSETEPALTNLKGQVALDGGVAQFADLSFGVPGASARMRGTYSLIDHKIDLRGQMQVETRISNATKGVKVVFLKVMETFFQKRKKGEVLPVRIGGTYENPSFGLDVLDPKAQQVKLPGQAGESGKQAPRPGTAHR